MAVTKVIPRSVVKRVNWGALAPQFRSSCPGLSRLRGRSRFGAAKARASTSFCAWGGAWMAGTSPAMTVRMLRAQIIAMAVLVTFISPTHAQPFPADFVYLRDIDPTIIQDIRYATANNFTGHRLPGYDAAECVVKRNVALKLKAIQQELARQNLSLKMFDCYRPTRAVADMVVWSRNGKETAAEHRYN